VEFGLIYRYFEIQTLFSNSTFGFRIVLAHNQLLMTLIRVFVTRGVLASKSQNMGGRRAMAKRQRRLAIPTTNGEIQQGSSG
jgi:hypothetical protein